METNDIIKYIGVLIIAVSINQVITSFSKKRYVDEAKKEIQELREEVIKYRRQTLEIAAQDSIEDLVVKKKLAKQDSIDLVLNMELDNIKNKNKKQRDAIKILEDDLSRYGINHTELPDF